MADGVGVPPGGPSLSSRNVASSADRRGSWGRDSEDLMERSTVVRCAEGHVFSTALPMQQAERLGPGRLIRCPRCARLRNVVPVEVELEKR